MALSSTAPVPQCQGGSVSHGELSSAINEKGKRGEAHAPLGFLLHAAFGLDHYPNYLHRWRAEDLDRLEAGLERQLEAVRAEKAKRLAKHASLERYVPQDPGAATAEALEAAFLPRVRAALRRRSAVALRELLREETPGVYSIALLDVAYCRRLAERVKDFAAWRTDRAGDGDPGAAAMSARTVVLAEAGMQQIAETLLRIFLRPLAGLLYDDCGGSSLDWIHGFVAGYAAAGGGEHLNMTRTSLVPHTDDSEVTLNLCLGRDFRGGELVLRGLRGSPAEGHAERSVVVEPGRAVLHRGQHLHEVLPVKGGERHALVLWARSTQYRGSVCPCCVLHRREERCICGPFWN